LDYSHRLGDIHCDILVCIGKGKVTKKSESGFRVGDKIRVNMHSGKIVDAVIKAVHDEYTDGPRYQADFGKEQTALIREWKVVKD
jgi:hypothetical protein